MERRSHIVIGPGPDLRLWRPGALGGHGGGMTTALIVCVSVSRGNTAAVADALAAPLGARVVAPEEVDLASLTDHDVVGFGSGIYYGSCHPRLRRLVETLPWVPDGAPATRAFVFTTSGQGRDQHLPWQAPLETLLRAKGYDVTGSFACRGHDVWGPLRLVGGINRGHPDARDLARAHAFAERVAGLLPA